MKKRRILLTVLTIAAVMLFAATAALADEKTAAADNAVTLYADYGDGFELLAALYFEDGVTEQTVTIDRSISALRVVKGVCYELNLDRLTLDGICPAGYERKLSATDNDLIEIEDSADFALSGSGELVIAARAPVEVMGENCSFKFPSINRGPIVPGSYFYSYTPGSNTGRFSRGDALTVPDAADLFASEMCYPDSGHPDAPMDIYVTDDGDTLYVFFEAFMDNTFDHGKDFAGVHVKCGDTVKTYKVHTTEDNEYGRWWFGYTDSSDEYDWEHMCYVVEMPLADLETNADGALDLAFEYYGTAGYQGKDLLMLGIGDVFLVADAQAERYPEAELLPAPGATRNAAGGDTATGDWWLTNNGGEFTLTLNGATLDSMSETLNYNNNINRFNVLYIQGNLTIELAEGTTNTIACNDSNNYHGIEAYCQELVIQGAGTLNVSNSRDSVIYVNDPLTIKDGATVDVTMNATHSGSQYWTSDWSYEAVDVFGLTVDDAVLKVTASVTVPSGSGDNVYVSGIEIGSTEYSLAVSNNSTVEAFASGGNETGGSYAISWYSDSMRLDLDADMATIMEGDTAAGAVEAAEVTTQNIYYSTRSKPYVKLTTANLTGDLTITKSWSGVEEDEDNAAAMARLAIRVSGDGFNRTVTYADFENGSYTLADLPVGEYTVKETNAASLLKGYALIADESTTKAAVEITENGGSVALINVYEEKEIGPGFSGGGSGQTPTNSVTTADTEGGSVSVAPAQAAAGDKVTVTAAPDEGKETDKVKVTDENGKTVPVKDNGDGTYSFTMPEGAVTVEVTFKDAARPSDKFTDVPKDAWYRDAVDYAVTNGLMVGTGDATFAPEADVTRAMLVTILYRLEGEPAVGEDIPFSDIPKDQWYTRAVVWAYENGIAEGYGEGRTGLLFGPDDPVTREQFAAILYRYAQYKGYDVSVGESTNILSYEDAASVSDWAVPAMQWACGAGLMQGDDLGNLLPGESATRAQAATLIMRFIENVK